MHFVFDMDVREFNKWLWKEKDRELAFAVTSRVIQLLAQACAKGDPYSALGIITIAKDKYGEFSEAIVPLLNKSIQEQKEAENRISG